MWQRLRQAIQFRQISAGAAGLLLGLLIEVLANWLTESSIGLVVVLTSIFVALLALNVWLWWRNPDRVSLRVDSVNTLRTQAERERYAQRGLVAFVSLYRPGRDGTASKNPKDWFEAAERKDYRVLDLPHSNLAPLIEAVMSHASRLEHCWLIGTAGSDPNRPGSAAYIPVLTEYLRRERGVKRTFHCGPECEIPMDDDALVFTKTVDLVKGIYLQARNDKQIALKPEEIIADFTGGMRSMPLGMILACLDSDRDIQMIGTHYDAAGKPTEALFPIVFKFQAIVRRS